MGQCFPWCPPERSTKTHRVFDCDAGPGHIIGIMEVEAIIRLLPRAVDVDNWMNVYASAAQIDRKGSMG